MYMTCPYDTSTLKNRQDIDWSDNVRQSIPCTKYTKKDSNFGQNFLNGFFLNMAMIRDISLNSVQRVQHKQQIKQNSASIQLTPYHLFRKI